MKKLPPGTLSGSQSALLRFVPSLFFEASVPHLPVDRSLRAPGQFRQLAGSNLVPGGSCLFPLCSWLLRPLQSLSRLASYTRFMVITTTESLYRPFRGCRSPKKNLYIHTLASAFLISPLLSRFLLRNPQEASRRLSISSADLSFPLLILFSLILSPTSSCPSETAIVATISPVTQYAF